MTGASRVREGSLQLGSNVVELLLQQRRPMLMVDRIEAFLGGPPASLEASRFISANEIFFEGHFPDLHLWPGCLTIEGMGQTGALLITILGIREVATAAGTDPDAMLDELRNLELGYRLHAGHRPDAAARFLAGLREQPAYASVGAAVDVKLTRPVFAGQRLDYRATLVHTLGDMLRFDVEASVDGATVAAGTMTGAKLRRFVPPARPR